MWKSYRSEFRIKTFSHAFNKILNKLKTLIKLYKATLRWFDQLKNTIVKSVLNFQLLYVPVEKKHR